VSIRVHGFYAWAGLVPFLGMVLSGHGDGVEEFVNGDRGETVRGSDDIGGVRKQLSFNNFPLLSLSYSTHCIIIPFVSIILAGKDPMCKS